MPVGFGSGSLMSILVISGSPSPRPSRSSTLLAHAVARLGAAGLRIDAVGLDDVPPADLVFARSGSEAAIAFRRIVAASDAVVIAAPVYNASIPGGLKALLDLLPEKALADKPVLPLASGGSAGHQLAIEYSLKPVLSALGARHVLAGVFACDADLVPPEVADGAAVMRPELAQRVDAAVDALIEALDGRGFVTRAVRHRSIRNPATVAGSGPVPAAEGLVDALAVAGSAVLSPERCSA